jgi:hypothetical protein
MELLKTYIMLVKHIVEKKVIVQLVDEVEGIMILLTLKPSAEYLNALEKLPVTEIKRVRDSYAEEFTALTGKHVLVQD